jgi:hypothetical protein
MTPIVFVAARVVGRTILAGTAACGLFMTPAMAQNQLTEPVYRVANEAAAQPAGPIAATTDVGTVAPIPARVALDFSQQPGEHPLAPAIRVCKASLNEMDRNIRDYSCTLVKQERIGGELGETQHIYLKVRHEPFSVYMSFLKPHQGREVLWVDGQNNGEMVVLEAGWKRKGPWP